MRPSVLLFCTVTLVLAACTKNQQSDGPVTLNADEKSVQVVTYMPVGDVADPVHGKQVYFGYGAVSGYGKQAANGVASLMVFEDRTSSVGLQVNIPVAMEGEFYEAWLLKPGQGISAWKSIGHLQSVIGDVRHALKSLQREDLSEYSELRITRESDDGDPAASGTIVAVATLKQAKR